MTMEATFPVRGEQRGFRVHLTAEQLSAITLLCEQVQAQQATGSQNITDCFPLASPEAHALRDYRTRRNRDRVFGADLFFDPAWEIMLDLFIARCRNKEICVSSACVASNAPPSTALRYLGLLIDQGIVIRRESESDRRMKQVSLSDRAFLQMSEILAKT